MEIYLLMSVMVFIPTARSVEVTISPKKIDVEAGTDSATFTCTVQLEMKEATSKHWIVWYDTHLQNIVDNDYAHTNPDKYSVYGVSSAASIHYTQKLQIHNIDEDDDGTYGCALIFQPYPFVRIFSASARLSVTNQGVQTDNDKNNSYKVIIISVLSGVIITLISMASVYIFMRKKNRNHKKEEGRKTSKDKEYTEMEPCYETSINRLNQEPGKPHVDKDGYVEVDG